MTSNERLAELQHERLTLVNKTLWNLFDAFEKSLVINNDPFFASADWMHEQRTLALRMGAGTGHSTFAKELATKHNAFLLTINHVPDFPGLNYSHLQLREMYYKFESPNIPSLFVIDDQYQFGVRIESLYQRLIKYRNQLGEDYLRSVRFVLLN